MSKLTLEIARKNVGKYIDCYKRTFGYYPMKIIEINGIPHLKCAVGVCRPVTEKETDFNSTYYDYIFTMESNND